MSVNQPTSLGVGTVVMDRYTVRAVVGRGGLGTVYQVRDERAVPPAIFALKETRDLSEAAREQFEREARWLRQLDHPNIPRVLDHFEWRDRLYLVMDYVSGENLEQRLARNGDRPLPEGEVLAAIRPIGDALSYLHTRTPPIIHRDVKPANIIVMPSGWPALVDLGIAKEHLPGMPNLTATFIRKAGTEGYAPPEQYISNGSTGPWSDIYSLGATIYHLLTGQVPASAVERAALDGQLVAPRALNPGISVRLESIIMRALAVRPVDRFGSMREMQAALGDESVTKTVRIFPMTALPSKPLCPRCNRPMAAPAPLCAVCAQELANRAGGLARENMPPGASFPPNNAALAARPRVAIDRRHANPAMPARAGVATATIPKPQRRGATLPHLKQMAAPLRWAVLALVIAALVGLALFGARLYTLAMPDESSPQTTISGYFNALKNSDYQLAYVYFSTKGVAQTPYAGFEQKQRQDQRDLGAITHTAISQIIPFTIDSEQIVVVVTRGQSPAPVLYTLTLTNNGGRWQIDVVTNGS